MLVGQPSTWPMWAHTDLERRSPNRPGLNSVIRTPNRSSALHRTAYSEQQEISYRSQQFQGWPFDLHGRVERRFLDLNERNSPCHFTHSMAPGTSRTRTAM